MAEQIIIPIIYQEDTSGLIRAAEEAKKLQETVGSVTDAQKKAFEGTVEAVDEYTAALENAGAEQAANEKTAKDLSKSLVDGAKNYRIFGTSINDVIGKLKSYKAGLTAIGKELRTGAGALKLFKVALAGTGIGLLVIAVASLVSFLTKTQKGIDIVNKALAGFTAGVSVVIDRASKLGETLFGIFSRPLSETLAMTKEAFSGIGDEIQREVDLAIQLEDQLQRVEKASILLNIEREASRAKIKELNLLAEDTTKGEKERASAAREAIAIEQELLDKRLENQKTLIANQLGQVKFTKQTEEQLKRIATGAATAEEVIGSLGLSESTIDDLREFEGVAVEFYRTQQESLELQTTLNNKLNTITAEGAARRKAALEEEQKRIEALKKEYESLFDTLNDQLQAAELNSLGIIDRIDKEQELALAALDKFRADLEEKAAALGIEKDFSEDFQKLADNIRKESEKAKEAAFQSLRDVRNALERGIEGALDGENVNLEPLGNAFENNFEKRAKEIFGNGLNKGAEAAVNEAGNNDTLGEAIERFKSGLLDKLGIDGEQAKAIFAGFNEAFQNILDSRQSLLQAEIDAQDELLDRLNDRVDEQEKALDRELELKKAGFANNYEAEKASLDAIQLEREAADKKKAELEAQAQKRQARLDNLQQVGSLITATANIFKGFSTIPIIGQILAGAAVAAMFASFAASKVNARKAAQKEFGGGGALDDYFSGEAKGDRHGAPGRGKGMQGMTKSGYPFLFEGREVIVNAKDAQEHKPFLLGLNDGKFRGQDLESLLAYSNLMKTGGMPFFNVPEVPDILSPAIPAIRESTKAIVTQREKAAMGGNIGKHFARLENEMREVKKAIQEKPNMVALPTGEIYTEKEVGNVKKTNIKTIKRNG